MGFGGFGVLGFRFPGVGLRFRLRASDFGVWASSISAAISPFRVLYDYALYSPPPKPSQRHQALPNPIPETLKHQTRNPEPYTLHPLHSRVQEIPEHCAFGSQVVRAILRAFGVSWVLNSPAQRTRFRGLGLRV